jgi:hypothetical protein
MNRVIIYKSIRHYCCCVGIPSTLIDPTANALLKAISETKVAKATFAATPTLTALVAL